METGNSSTIGIGKQKRFAKAFKSKRKRRKASEAYQTLEKRAMLDANPIAIPDFTYHTGKTAVLDIIDPAQGLLANDFDAEGSNLSVSVVTQPDVGSLTFNSNGTFTYTPNGTFFGVDTFTYQISDGNNLSAPAAVKIKVGHGLSANQLSDDVSNDSFLHDGALSLELPIGNGFSLNYRSDTVPTVLVPIDTFLTPGLSIPDSITANLTVDGVSSGDVHFSNAGLASGEPLRFVLRTLNYQSESGTYDWSADVSLNYGSHADTETFSGKTNIVNRTSSEFGSGWWLTGLDRLHVQPDGVMLENGDGSNFWFAQDGPGFSKAEGDLSYSTLSHETNGDFTLIDKWKNVRTFDSNGKLQSTRSSNNDVADYTFEYLADGRIDKIVDQFNREFNFTWNGAVLQSVSDFAGRASTFSIANGLLNSATVADESQSGYVAPEWQYGYQTIGGREYLNSVVSPDNTQTDYVYRTGSRTIQEIVHADGESWKLFATAAYGLKFGSGNTVTKVDEVNARYTDERNKVFKFETDRFGDLVSLRTPLGSETSYEFDTNGQLYRAIGADPDGNGPGQAPVTEFGYDSSGNLVKTVNADGTSSSSTFDLNWNQIASFTNELGDSEYWTYDPNGNVETHTDAEDNVWTYQWDDVGNLLTEISPPVADGVSNSALPPNQNPGNDPDSDSHFDDNSISIVTTYEYENSIYNRLEKITFDDGTTQQFTWTAADQLETFADELGRVTAYEYDPLDRMISSTLPDPDGPTGPKLSPVYEWSYGQDLLLENETDALGNVTHYDYDEMGRLIKVTLPNPTYFAWNNNTAPEYNYDYDAAGNLIWESDPTFSNGAAITYTYDNDGRLETTTGPVAGQITTYSYDKLDRLIGEVDPSGRNVVYTYNINDELVSVSDHDGSTVTYVYDDAGQLVSESDQLGRTTVYHYFKTGWLKTTTLPDPDGSGPTPSPVYTNVYDTLGRLAKEIDPLDRDEVYIYDSRHRVIEHVHKDPDFDDGENGPLMPASTLYRHDAVGRMVEMEDVLNRITVYAYDDLDRLSLLTLPDPDGDAGPLNSPVETYDYDVVGNLVSTIDARGNETTIEYDNLYRQRKVTLPDPDGPGPLEAPVWQFGYHANTQLSSVIDPLGETATRGYDDAGRLNEFWAGSADKLTTYEYDLVNRITSITSPDPDGPTGLQESSVTSYEYDIRSRLIKTVDANDGETTRVYDDANQLLQLIDAEDNSTRWAYDNLGRMTMETKDNLFHASHFKHDTRSYHKNLAGRTVRKVDRLNRVTEYGKEGLSRTEEWVAPHNATTWTATIVEGNGTDNEHQEINLWGPMAYENPGIDYPPGICYPLPDGTIICEDSPPDVPPTNQIATAWFRLSFDGQVTKPVPNNATAAELEAALEELESIDDVTVVEHPPEGDTFNELYYFPRPYSVIFHGEHAGVDVPEIMTDVYSSQIDEVLRTMTFVHDRAGRLVEASDPTATYNFAYDDLDRVISKTEEIDSLTFLPIDFDYEYNPVGQRTSLTAFIGGTADFVNTYEYDNLNRLITLQQSDVNDGSGGPIPWSDFNIVADKRVAYSYNKLGQTTYVNRFEATTNQNPAMRTVFAYDGDHRMEMMQHRQVQGLGQSTALQTYDYQYDNLDRFTQIDSSLDGVSDFNYDNLHQLTNADHAVDRPDEIYYYDDVGNRVGDPSDNGSSSGTTGGGSSTSGTTGGSGNFDTDPDAEELVTTYDAEGNRLIGTVADNYYLLDEQNFFWDHRNRLVKFESGFDDPQNAGFAEYEYDVFNRLVRRVAGEMEWVEGSLGDTDTQIPGGGGAGGPGGSGYTTDPGGGGGGSWEMVVTDTVFAGFDGKTHTLEFEPSDDGRELVRRTLRRGDQVLAVENIDSTDVAGEVLWALNDHLGTVRDIASNNNAGQFEIVNHRVFSSFGVLTSETNSDIEFDYGFTGRWTDSITGLTHHLNRWYKPASGKWMSEDPIGFAAGDVNVHRYVGNMANNLVDLNGLFAAGDPTDGSLQHAPDPFGGGAIAPPKSPTMEFIKAIPGGLSESAQNMKDGMREFILGLGRGVVDPTRKDTPQGQLADSVIGHTETVTGAPFAGTPEQWDVARGAFVNELTGVQEMAEGIVGFETENAETIEDPLERAGKTVQGFTQFTGTVSGPVARIYRPAPRIGGGSGRVYQGRSTATMESKARVKPQRTIDGIDVQVGMSKRSQKHLLDLPEPNASTTAHAGFHVAPKNITGISGLTRSKPKTPVKGGGGLRKRWKDSKGNIFEWDSLHGALEKYNKKGTHLGEFDPATGARTKPADPSRNIKKFL